MSQALLFVTSVLLCLELVGSLHCSECLYETEGICLAGKRTCTAYKRCVSVTIHQDGFDQFRSYGCIMPPSYFCGMSKTQQNGQRIIVKCCRKRNCNANRN